MLSVTRGKVLQKVIPIGSCEVRLWIRDGIPLEIRSKELCQLSVVASVEGVKEPQHKVSNLTDLAA